MIRNGEASYFNRKRHERLQYAFLIVQSLRFICDRRKIKKQNNFLFSLVSSLGTEPTEESGVLLPISRFYLYQECETAASGISHKVSKGEIECGKEINEDEEGSGRETIKEKEGGEGRYGTGTMKRDAGGGRVREEHEGARTLLSLYWRSARALRLVKGSPPYTQTRSPAGKTRVSTRVQSDSQLVRRFLRECHVGAGKEHQK